MDSISNRVQHNMKDQFFPEVMSPTVSKNIIANVQKKKQNELFLIFYIIR